MRVVVFGDGGGELDGEMQGGIDLGEGEGPVKGFGTDLYVHQVSSYACIGR